MPGPCLPNKHSNELVQSLYLPMDGMAWAWAWANLKTNQNFIILPWSTCTVVVIDLY